MTGHKFILVALTLFLCLNTYGQKSIQVNLFETTDQYKTKTYSKENVKLLVKQKGEDYIWFKKFVDAETGKKIPKAHTSWAIEYEGDVYFNLGYSNDLNNWKIFIKLDVEGPNYCLSFIDDDTPNVVKNSSAYYGGGITGALISESTKWGRHWFNSSNEKIKILFIDLNNQKQGSMSRNVGSIGDLLTPAVLVKEFSLEKSKDDVRRLSFEEVLEIIQAENK